MGSIAKTWGSTETERSAAFPCDAHVAEPFVDLFRAVSIDAPPGVVFRWLCQLRVAPYSYDWLDNFGRTSPRALTPGLDDLARGQRVMTIFRIVDFARDDHLTLAVNARLVQLLLGDLAVTYRVVGAEGHGSRLVVKLRGRSGRTFLGRARAWLLSWGDLVMMRKQLLTLKRLAERDAHDGGSG